MNEGLRSLVSNPSVLSIVCTLFARHGVITLEKTRVQLYEKVVELMLHRWQYHQSNISRDALVSIFSNMAFYIHSQSGSGFIDEFDLNHLCRLSLQQWYTKTMDVMRHDSLKIRQQTEQFMQLLSEDAGIVAARALGIYGFLHMTFQEYFVCQALVNVDDPNIKNDLVPRFLSLFPNPRLRESLNLVLGWISLYWSSENYDDFCIELYSKTHLANKHIPLGSLWFVSALNDIACLPSSSIVYNILSALLDAHTHEDWKTYIFKKKLMAALDRLPITLVNSWFDHLFLKEDEMITLKMLHILYEVINKSQPLQNWITSITCEILWKQIGLLNEEIDIYIDRILTIIGAKNCDRLPTLSGSMREYLLSRSFPTSGIHASILAAIIALYGGLERNHSKTKRQTSIIFTARRIHRDSPLSPLFIEYMEDRVTERTLKLKRLIDQCQKTVATATTINITPQVIHSLVVLFCLYNIDQPSNYEQYIGSEVWQQAVRYMKVTLLYLREFFCMGPCSKFNNNLTDICEHFVVDFNENILNFAQSISHAYCQLLRGTSSCFLSDAHKYSCNPLIVIKMPQTINLLTMTHWNEDELVRLLPFICCVAPISANRIMIDELETEDLKLLKEGMHPFQLLQNKPITLLLAYLPTSVQSLYMQLLAQKQISFDETSTLPFLHLLTEFLCVALTMETFSIRFWVLFSILLPTIAQYKMENFILRFIQLRQLERKYKRFFEAYKDSCFHFFTSKMRIGDYKEEVCAEKLAMIEEQHRLTNAQTDLQLYAASCCIARLSQSRYAHNNWEVLKIEFRELWAAVQEIKRPVWRLDATITICYILSSNKRDKQINNQLEDPYPTLMTCLKELERITPLLTYVALFVRCMNLIDKNFQLEKSLIYDILQRLKTVTIAEQQAICEALISFPSLRHDIIQYVRQTQQSENAVKLNQGFRRTSITFLKHLSEKFFLTSDIREVRSALLASMYLCELNSYMKFLNDSLIKETHHHTINNPKSQSLGAKYLEKLEEDPVQSLTVGAASMISVLLSSCIAEIENVELIRIEQALVKKTNMDVNASSIVFQWLSYRCDKRLCSFAYQGALLLALSNTWTPTIVEICCELLTSKCDHFRNKANELIRDKKWQSEKESNNIIINYLDYWNKNTTKWLSEIQGLFCSLAILTIEEIEQILQREYNRFEKTIQNKSNIIDKTNNYSYEVSFFQLVQNLSLEVIDYITTIMQLLSTYFSDSTELLFLHWLLKRIPCELLQNHENFINFLVEILRGSYPVKIKMAAARNLFFFREKKQVQSLLWNIVINNEQEDSDELVVICMRSLFIDRRDDRYMQKKLKKLDRIREHARSSLIRQAALSAMYSHVIIEPEKYDIVDVYYSYMRNAGFYRGSWPQLDDGYDRARDWIIKYASTLLPQFTDDIYKSFGNASDAYVEDYIEVAKRICAKIPNEFRVAVRQSSVGEDTFRKGLYEVSKNISTSDQENCLHVYACFKQVSLDYVLLLLNLRFERSWHIDYVEQLQFVSERRAIELLADTLQSSLSLRQRRAAAELLVHLTMIDQVSSTEVQKLLAAAIDDPFSQQFSDLEHQTDRVEQKFRTLLIQLMVEPLHRVLNYGSNIDMLNETSDPQISAAVFQKTTSTEK